MPFSDSIPAKIDPSLVTRDICSPPGFMIEFDVVIRTVRDNQPFVKEQEKVTTIPAAL